MKTFFLILTIFLSTELYSALEYSKEEFAGCPENSFCKKETGVVRQTWLNLLRDFSAKKITEQKMNALIQSSSGIPISSWAEEDANLLPHILMWDSPCKQHRSSHHKYYIAEIFRKNLHPHELKNLSHLIFSRAVLLAKNNTPQIIVTPRGDIPLFIENQKIYYLREEEGIFYGLFIDFLGNIKVTTNLINANPPKDIDCKKELITIFNRESIGPLFYQDNYCKNIWDKSSNTYQTIIFGRSCD